MHIPLIQVRSVDATHTLLINRQVRSALRKLERRIHQVSHNALRVCLARAGELYYREAADRRRW
jgi:hypothetical protein